MGKHRGRASACGIASKIWRDERGQSLLVFVLMLAVLLGAAGLAVDIGSAYATSSRLQSAVDAGALAGAEASATGKSVSVPGIVGENDAGAHNIQFYCNPSSCTGGTGQTVTVTVTAQDEAPGGFAALFGVRQFTVSNSASAAVVLSDVFQYAVFQGDPNLQDTLTLTGNTTVNGDVHSNDNLDTSGNDHISGVGTASGQYTGNPKACTEGCSGGSPLISMPIWTVSQLENWPGVTIVGSSQSPVSCTIRGSGGSSSETLDCGSQSYTITPGSLPNFLIFGSLDISGSLTLDGSFITVDGPITVDGNVQASNNNGGSDGLVLAALPSNGDSTGGGPSVTVSGTSTIEGTLYAPDGTVKLNGQGPGKAQGATITGSVIGYHITLMGTPAITYSPPMTGQLPDQLVALVRSPA